MEDRLEIRPVDRTLWKDFEKLFEERGGPKSCWCMVWRPYAKPAESTDKAARKQGMQHRILSGEPVGLLAYLDGEPVAWCSVAPRQTFKDSLDGQTGDSVAHKWSVTCFFIKRAHRGKGFAERLIDAACDLARSRGARILEAYPVAPDSPSYRFCGFLEQFERHGFHKTGTVGSRRNIVTMEL